MTSLASITFAFILVLIAFWVAYRVVNNYAHIASQAEVYERFNSNRYPESKYSYIIGETGSALVIHEVMTGLGLVSHIVIEVNSGDRQLNRVLVEELVEKLNEIKSCNVGKLPIL